MPTLVSNRRRLVSIALLATVLASPGLSAPDETALSIRQHVDAEFHNGDFEALERRAASYRDPSQRTADGLWKLGAFYQQLAVNTGRPWVGSSLEGSAWTTIERWLQRHPGSVAAIFARVMALCTYAQMVEWAERNGKLPTEQWTADSAALDEAMHLLDEVRTRAKEDPHWHALRLRIMRLARASSDDLIIAHDEALAEWPGYYDTHLDLLDHLMEAWIGRPHLIEAFTNTVYERTREAEGEQVYARLLQRALENKHGHRLFTKLRVDWNRLKSGYRQMIERFPSSKNAQQLALLACLKGDWSSAAEVFRTRDEPPAREVWGQPFAYRSCRESALK